MIRHLLMRRGWGEKETMKSGVHGESLVKHKVKGRRVPVNARDYIERLMDKVNEELLEDDEMFSNSTPTGFTAKFHKSRNYCTETGDTTAPGSRSESESREQSGTGDENLVIGPYPQDPITDAVF